MVKKEETKEVNKKNDGLVKFLPEFTVEKDHFINAFKSNKTNF